MGQQLAEFHWKRHLEELLRTNNPVTLSFVQSFLDDAGIENFVMDMHMSILDGSIGILPRRIMVPTDDLMRARQLVVDHELGKELPEKPLRPV